MIHDNIFDLFPEQTAEFMKSVRNRGLHLRFLLPEQLTPKMVSGTPLKTGLIYMCGDV
jgi:hypothetical protein